MQILKNEETKAPVSPDFYSDSMVFSSLENGRQLARSIPN
jgi:hypothetical protein